MVHTVSIIAPEYGIATNTKVDIYPCGKGTSKSAACRAAAQLFGCKPEHCYVIASRPV